MGITIHYDFRFEGSLGCLGDVLRNIRRDINNLDVISASKVSIFDKAYDCDHGWKEHRGFGFEVQVMEGCEWFTCILFDRGNNLWTAHNFTKTQYCESFEKGHKLVIEMLKICRKYGILERVSDEGGYWENGNDEELIQAKQENTALINMVGKALAGRGVTLVRGDGVVIKGKDINK